MKYDYLIVGAGFSGAVCAQQLSSSGKSVLLIDKRNHIGGNAYDTFDNNGVLIHPYGPHIFHTNSKEVFDYLSRFTAWRLYEHKVLASVGDKLYQFPVNRKTINSVFEVSLEDEASSIRFLSGISSRISPVLTSEDYVLNKVGPLLCDIFYRHYTRKQWGMEISQLSAKVASRIPVRHNEDDRYFTDRYQAMPANGYSTLFMNMISSPLIDLQLNASFEEFRAKNLWRHMIYTGPIDEYYQYRYGRLPYRSIRFEHSHFCDLRSFQEVGTINYPSPDTEFTRITEFKHLTGQAHSGTSIVKEYPTNCGDPYYPIPMPDSQKLYKCYSRLASSEENVIFLGRLAQYRYYNMDHVVAAALTLCKGILGKVM